MEHLLEWDLAGEAEIHASVLLHPLQTPQDAYILRQTKFRVPGPDSTVYTVSCTATTMCLHIGWYADDLTYLVWLTCVVRISEEWLNTNSVIFNSILQPSTQVDTLAVVGSAGNLEPYISFWLVMICYQMLKSFFNLIARVKRTKIIDIKKKVFQLKFFNTNQNDTQHFHCGA